MHRFPDLIARHRVDPGHLVHIGAHGGQAVPFYYEAGFNQITMLVSGSNRATVLRTRFPGVDVRCVPIFGEGSDRLDALFPRARVMIVSEPGGELAILASVPWDSVDLLIISTSIIKITDFASPYDLVTEAVTTRGFVEVDRWTREHTGSLDVIFMKGARL